MSDSDKFALMAVMLLMLLLIVYRIARHANNDPDNKFSFSEAFLDVNGKTSMREVCVFVALVVSTWGFVAMVVTEGLTEFYFGTYIGAFVLNAIGGKFAEKKD
jgi:hypothetical protein